MAPNRKLAFRLVLLLTPVVLAGCLLMGPAGVGLSGSASIMQLRLIRVLAGFVVGAGLACAGVVLQALLRNPLAEPYVLGVSSGAGLGAAVVILTGLATVSVIALPLGAFVFGLATLALVYRLASGGGTPSIYSLLLSGVIVSAVCSSILMFLVSIAPVEGLHSVLWWMLGNLQVPSRKLLAVSGATILAGCLGIWLLARELNALTFGREVAHHVGVHTRAALATGLVLASLVTATAVGLAGLIGFVGLVVPHTLRTLVGPDHRRLVPAAALAGGAVLAVCDAIGRTVLGAHQIPVGVVTALVGGPFFLVVLRNRRRSGWVE
ncbi:MAG: iron ABC transporter permease [Kiritimatiellae bacterium]|nr:iron ABC transporter permease [Kiritimatiellia bacterium]